MRRVLLIVAGLSVTAVVAWVLFVGLPRWTAPRVEAPPPPAPPPTIESTRRISARLFHVAEDGSGLRTADAEVEFAENTLEQARHLLRAQLQPAAPPLISAVPAGTTLREVFITSDGVAYVDLSKDVSAGHPGGSRDEILTVYSLVNVLTDNLPAIRAVQIVVEGREVDTLAGHIDLRHPLEKNLALLEARTPDAPEAADAGRN